MTVGPSGSIARSSRASPPFTLDLSATGKQEVWVDVHRERVPGEYSLNQVLRSRGYPASGTVTLGGEPVVFDLGLISRNSGHSSWKFPTLGG